MPDIEKHEPYPDFDAYGPPPNSPHPNQPPQYPATSGRLSAALYYLPNLIAAIAASVGVVIGSVGHHLTELSDEPTVVMCGHGERAMGAASLLAAAGHHNLVVLEGGPHDWVTATGGTLQSGS